MFMSMSACLLSVCPYSKASICLQAHFKDMSDRRLDAKWEAVRAEIQQRSVAFDMMASPLISALTSPNVSVIM